MSHCTISRPFFQSPVLKNDFHTLFKYIVYVILPKNPGLLQPINTHSVFYSFCGRITLEFYVKMPYM